MKWQQIVSVVSGKPKEKKKSGNAIKNKNKLQFAKKILIINKKINWVDEQTCPKEI